MTLLSVGVPTWNGEATVGRALASLLAQEGVDLEILVCDDASRDGTVAAARRLEDPRLAIHAFPERLGLSDNWNRVLGLARGKYVSIVGQDDAVDPVWATRLTGLLERHPEADLAFCRRRFAFDDEQSRRVLGPFFLEKYPALLDSFYRDIGELLPSDQMIRAAMGQLFEINLIGEPAFVIFRRESPAVENGFDRALGQMLDWEFWTRFFARGPLLHCPEELGTYHLHARGASFSQIPLSRHYREYQHLLGKVLDRFALEREHVVALTRRRAQAAILAAEWAAKEG